MKLFTTAVLLILLITLIAFPLASAELIPDVTYAGGHPDIQTDKLKNGSINVLSDRIEYSIAGGEGIKIPFSAIERVYIIDNPTGRPYLKTAVIATSVVAAGILAAPAFSILGAKKHRYFLSLDFKDDMDVPHTTSFRLKGENALRAKASIDAAMDKYKRASQVKPMETVKSQAIVQEAAKDTPAFVRKKLSKKYARSFGQ